MIWTNQRDQVAWDIYRKDPKNKGLLEAAGVGGSEAMDAALASRHIVCPAEEDDDGPIYLGPHVTHTLLAQGCFERADAILAWAEDAFREIDVEATLGVKGSR